MMRVVCGFVALVVVSGSACTLLLPTNELIKPCTEQADCDAGFVCEDNACLPEDVVDDTGEGEGEGEGETG